jgi:hypothetical protein
VLVRHGTRVKQRALLFLDIAGAVALTQKIPDGFGNTGTSVLQSELVMAGQTRIDCADLPPSSCVFMMFARPIRFDATCRPSATRESGQLMNPSQAAISCHENEIPTFVEPELERLYGNIFSSLRQFRIYGWTPGRTSTYVVRENGELKTILLFEREGARLRVMNEVIALDSAELERFVQYVFSTFESVSVIAFKAIQTDIRRFPFPYQRFNHIEDMTLTLPPTVDAYHASLGKNTRRNIRRHLDRLGRDFPSYRFEILEKDAVDPQLVRDIIEFNRARMADKNIVSIIDEEETRRIIRLVQECGLVGVVTIDGRLCAGAISFRSGSNYFLNVLAHDPRYDDYWLGFLCCYMTINECIARGGDEFHFLWGRYGYKFLLGAVQRDLDNVIIYRSRAQLLRNADFASRIAYEGNLRRLKVWLKYDDGVLSQHARRLMERLRTFKRSITELSGARRDRFLEPSQEQ